MIKNNEVIVLESIKKPWEMESNGNKYSGILYENVCKVVNVKARTDKDDLTTTEYLTIYSDNEVKKGSVVALGLRLKTSGNNKPYIQPYIFN